ncbi:hypothetical protein BU23DRAFT_561160 [Bimuria novae-zelandiae CBS 107.79]|uniref:Mid2 domain-containing protein n=1 Tax=Bimuria novae-zelandiae CBS 107.79 TaxID=1447943 RepID=A0A6A5UQY5_9PLEO|nr:hypothetical protein BU23DRAFT_561160 [Bimuria novae-zelandiae CBS 107.79]
MWVFQAPAAVVSLLALTILPLASAKLSPSPTTPARLDDLARLRYALAKRQCGNPCGYDGWLCCNNNEQCLTVANQASCAQGLATGGGGQWVYSTIYYTEEATLTKTSLWSSFIGGAAATGASCSANQQKCDTTCCGSGEYCYAAGTCSAIGGSGSPGVTGINPSAPVRPTSSGVIVITATGSATATVPFGTPIPTGVNGTLVEQNPGGGGLSGGAIAGIVIGVIAGIILLLLICFYCCAKAAFDGVLALFGLGKKRGTRTHEETTYISEHHSGAAGAAGGRRWYGQGASRPSRPPKKSSGGFGKMLGVGAGVAGLAALLGMRKNDRKQYDDKSTTITDSSYYYSDYTSTSSASSDDRRTRHTRQSSRR